MHDRGGFGSSYNYRNVCIIVPLSGEPHIHSVELIFPPFLFHRRLIADRQFSLAFILIVDGIITGDVIGAERIFLINLPVRPALRFVIIDQQRFPLLDRRKAHRVGSDTFGSSAVVDFNILSIRIKLEGGSLIPESDRIDSLIDDEMRLAFRRLLWHIRIEKVVFIVRMDFNDHVLCIIPFLAPMPFHIHFIFPLLLHLQGNLQ
jgi:hypothetical protein